jgi:hypothetical protein
MKVVLVAFKVEKENSVAYKKLDNHNWNDESMNFWDFVGQAMGELSEKSDFVSVRFIKSTEQPETKKQ